MYRALTFYHRAATFMHRAATYDHLAPSYSDILAKNGILPKITNGPMTKKGRRGRDSNPRYLAVHKLSKLARSATLTPLRLIKKGSQIYHSRLSDCIKKRAANSLATL
jgi:hypothetical protein